MKALFKLQKEKREKGRDWVSAHNSAQKGSGFRLYFRIPRKKEFESSRRDGQLRKARKGNAWLTVWVLASVSRAARWVFC